CSKNNGPDPNKQELVVVASATEIDKGDEVTFEVTAGDKAIDADIYINNTKTTSTAHTFNEAGAYQIVAKKEGYPESEAITLKVYQVDVYVAGVLKKGQKRTAVYWRNGKPVMLT